MGHDRSSHCLIGLEADNLLSWLALLGLLRALDRSRPEWQARARWEGPPWTVWLDVVLDVSEDEIAEAATVGIEAIAAAYDVDGRANVSFTPAEYHEYARRMVDKKDTAYLSAALAAELPLKKDGSIQAGPLVMMFGQGHQNFLERLTAIPRGELPARLQRRKSPPDLRTPEMIKEALFHRWERSDDTDGFRWDPEDDQRYALRYDDPSRAGAASTVHGANRLASIGFLSYPSFPGTRLSTLGVRRGRGAMWFVWPLWRPALSLHGIEHLLAHPAVAAGDLQLIAPYGVAEIYEARRVANGKFLNIARARPVTHRFRRGDRG